MRFAGAVMIFAVCVYGGFSFSDVMKRRCVYLRNVIAALSLLETEITFGGSRLAQAFIKLDGAADTRGLFKAAAENAELTGIKKAWKKAVKSRQGELCFTESDAQALMSLGERLGMTDTENQVKNIQYVKKQLELQLGSAEGEYDRLGRLYRNGGILVGAFLILLLA